MDIRPRALVLSLSAAALLAGCGTAVVNPVTGQTERTVMSEQDEIEEGREAHAEIVKEFGVVENPRLQAYVDGVGQKLAKQSHRANLKWTFTVLDTPDVNAFALPGGYVYVTRGIMAYLDSEAELAGVVGHEIGHVTARHGAQRATRQQRAGIGVLAATVLGAVLESQGYSGAGRFASDVSQSVAAGYIASYSREQELQADELGAEYLARNQYNPQNMVDVIGALKAQERYAADAAKAEGKEAPSGANWLSSHPSNDQRLAEIRQIAAKYKGDYSEDGRKRYQQAIDGMAFGESAEQGLTRGRNFYHEGLGIALTAPQGWKIDNSPSAILLVNGAGDAGLVVKLLSPQAGKTHEEIIRNAVKPTGGQTQQRNLNGLAATHFTGVVRNSQGQQSNARLTLVTGPGNRNYVLQYAARDAATLQRNLAGIVEAENSFRALGAAERKAAQPWKIDIVPLPAGGFAELAKRSPLTTMAEQQLRLINGVYNGGTEPKVGQPVKVVR
ncbi:MAG: M48 family metalloprotease [Gammaproteobacteria bacterium]|nr:M48 family metalloprotease [Gammaproteobacteria bacterium]MBU1415909.1 M48 family metalloprotease [Gammaproteobacteria bacterium]